MCVYSVGLKFKNGVIIILLRTASPPRVAYLLRYTRVRRRTRCSTPLLIHSDFTSVRHAIRSWLIAPLYDVENIPGLSHTVCTEASGTRPWIAHDGHGAVREYSIVYIRFVFIFFDFCHFRPITSATLTNCFRVPVRQRRIALARARGLDHESDTVNDLYCARRETVPRPVQKKKLAETVYSMTRPNDDGYNFCFIIIPINRF